MSKTRDLRALTTLIGSQASHIQPLIIDRLAKAIYRAGWRPPTAAAAPAAVVGQAIEPDARQGMIAHVVHTVPAQQVAEHGVDALTAWVRQALRDVEQAGGDPRDAGISLVRMGDGTVVVTAEGSL